MKPGKPTGFFSNGHTALQDGKGTLKKFKNIFIVGFEVIMAMTMQSMVF
jgi:hypothetical protein